MISASILKRARERDLLRVDLVQIRDFGEGRHRRVDDTPFGGGPGMVLKADVLDRALQSVAETDKRVIYLSPQGKPFNHEDAKRLTGFSHLVLVCGHYEGVDERFITNQVDEELSLGDFVLTGGEIPAMAIMDAVSRLLPGVIGDEASFTGDSFYHGLLDYPHFTRPACWVRESTQDVSVPKVLLSGNHRAIDDWRRRQSLLRTLIRRPDWLERASLTRAEQRLIESLAQDLEIMDSEYAGHKSINSKDSGGEGRQQ